MTWTIRLAKEAEKQLKKLPFDRQEFIRRHLRDMTRDPFAGDVKPLKGKEWKGRYRKRIGRYRFIFLVSHKDKIIEISAILLRTEKTYD